MRFVVFGSLSQSHQLPHVEQLLHILQREGASVSIERYFYLFIREHTHIDLEGVEAFSGQDFEADMAISIGGDGTFLATAEQVRDKGIPIIGIHTGRLGFLSQVTPDQLEEAFKEILRGDYTIDERSLLELSAEGHELEGYPYALNEVAILKRDTSSMIKISTYIDGELLNHYQADGLIIATPTGSTAYSLSVGGPIVMSQSDCICVTAVAPHTFSVRPIVLPNTCEVQLEVESRSHNFLVAVDGRSETCPEYTRLTIRRAPYTIRTVERTSRSFLSVLRDKLLWGVDQRQ